MTKKYTEEDFELFDKLKEDEKLVNAVIAVNDRAYKRGFASGINRNITLKRDVSYLFVCIVFFILGLIAGITL